jgi:hypothetical protein
MTNNIIQFPTTQPEQVINDSFGKALDLIGEICDKIKAGSETKESLVHAMLKLSVLVVAIGES